MLLPLAIGAGIAAALVLASRSASAASSARAMARLNAVVPSRRRGGASSSAPVVPFETTLVPWRTSRRTGKVERRTEVVQHLPELVAAAGMVLGRKVAPEAFALAAMAASEARQDLAKVAIMHAAITRAGGAGGRLIALLAPGGRLGSQHGRYASTRVAPTVRDVELAEAVLAGRLANPVPGAVQWDSPATQDRLAASGAPGYVNKDGSLRDREHVAAVRRAEGKEAVALPGIPEDEIRLWRRAA